MKDEPRSAECAPPCPPVNGGENRRGRPEEDDRHAEIRQRFADYMRRRLRRSVAVRLISREMNLEKDTIRKIIRGMPPP
jgi:DNA invertase Pin-like site-specific DNA recombinase